MDWGRKFITCTEHRYYVERLVAKRIHEGVTLYQVKWVGWGSDSNTWEPLKILMEDCPVLVKEFEDEQRTKAEPKTNNVIAKQGLKRGARGGKAKAITQARLRMNAKRNLKGVFVAKLPTDNKDEIKMKKKTVSTQVKASRTDAPAREREHAVAKRKDDVKEKMLHKIDRSQKTTKEKTALEIIGITEQKGVKWYFVKWENSSELSFVPSSDARKAFPHLVIQFLEERMFFFNEQSSKRRLR